MYKLLGYRSNEDGGASFGLLKDVREFSATIPLNDVSSLTFSYPRQGQGIDSLFNQFFEVAVVHNPVAGPPVEVPGGRFILAQQENDGTETSGDVRFTMVGYAWPLNVARVMGLTGLNGDGKREFVNATAGGIMKTLLDENKARGWHPGLTYTFTSGLDSNGQAWATQLPKIEYDPTMDLFTILDNLVKQGLCDWYIQGRELRLVKPDLTLAGDKTSVVLRYGVDLLEGPNQVQTTNLRHNALVLGEGGKTRSVDQVPGTPQPWGKWFDAISQGGVSDDGTMDAYAQRSLQAGKLAATQLTRTLVVPSRSGYIPFSAFAPGDYITAPNVQGAMESLRIREIGVRYSDGNHRVDLTLNDRITEQGIRLSRRIVGIVGGTTQAGGSGGQPVTNDTRIPKAPTGLILTSDAYIASGRPMGRVQVDWDAVTQATDNTTMSVSGYEIWARSSGVASYQAATTQSGDQSVILASYFPGSVWYFKVRARASNDRYSAFSTEVAITIANDTTPPDQPSTPGLVSDFGVLRLTWDGKTSSNTGQQSDWTQTIVHVSATNGFTPNADTARDTLTGPGTVIIGDVPFGETRYVRLVSQDWAGNLSAPSAQVSAVQTAPELSVEVDGENISPGSIDFSKLRSGVYNLIPDPYFRSAEINAIRKNGSSVINFQQPNATYPHGHVELSGLVSCYLSATAAPVASDAPMDVTPGAAHIFQMEVERLSGAGTWSVYIESLRSDGVVLATTLLASGTATANVSQVWTAPAGAVKARLIVNHPAGNVTRLRKPLLVPRIFTDQIPDSIITAGKISANAITSDKILAGAVVADKIATNAITSDKIVANSVTSAKIAAGAVTASAISAGAIDGKTIVGATIRTAATGPRIEMTSTGIYQIDSDGVAWSYWTPNVFALKSGTTGARIELTNTAIRVYNAASQPTFLASAADGSLQIAGTFRTNPAGVFPRTEIFNTASPGSLFGVDFYTVAGQANYPSIKAVYAASVGDWVRNGLVLQTGSGSNPTQLLLNANGNIRLVSLDNDYGYYLSGSMSTIVGQLSVTSPGSTTGSANLARLGTSEIRTVSSLSRYKLEQEPVGAHYEVLDLRTKTWVDRASREADPEYNERFVGVIAEEAEALSAANGGSLDPLLAYADGELSGFNYDRLATVLIPVIRDMNERLTALEAQ